MQFKEIEAIQSNVFNDLNINARATNILLIAV